MKTRTESDMILKNAKNIHMIGIGGSGMFPIAEILHHRGVIIDGSDNNPGDIIDKERALGISVTIGHDAANLKNPDCVIYSAAIHGDNPELAEAERRGIPCFERSLALGALSREYDNVVAVSGTHGKTSTTSMITQTLMMADLDPSAVIGGKLPYTGTYGTCGNSETFVCEACEFVDTFLQISPDIAIILNIDNDHLEYFKTIENLTASFVKFANSATKAVILNGDCQRTAVAKAQIDASKQIITFGRNAGNDYTARNVHLLPSGCYGFDLYKHDEFVVSIELSVPGEHNVMNALAAAVACFMSGATPTEVAYGLNAFRGAGRRFEILASEGGVTIADDYAHHPTELEATLKTAKAMGKYNRVIAVFQPFTFSRTAMLLDDFVRVLQIADEVVLTPIMGSREVNTYGIKSADLTAKIPHCHDFATFDEVAQYAAQIAEEGDLIITLGCGDVYKVARKIIELLCTTVD